MGAHYAMCEGNHLIIKGWMGPYRATEAEAEADAKKHKEDTYDHEVLVVYDQTADPE